MKNLESISDLLPEGVTEATLNKICTLVDSVITEQVEERATSLEAKVHGFLRMKIEDLKEHALKELESENETFRNAKIFESLKSLMALELSSKDDDNAVQRVMSDNEDLSEEVALLASELKTSLEESSSLEQTIHALSSKVSALEEEKRTLQEKTEALEESKQKPFKSSEQAIVISDNVDTPQRTKVTNEFLTEDVMKFMPFNN